MSGDSEGTGTLRVGIIGAGFSGTLVAIHLLRQDGCVEIDLIEPRLAGRGLAYSTVYDQHLLNVPAVRMSAFGSQPMHFLEWIRANGLPAADANMFAPRKLYGAYIQSLLETTLRGTGSQNKLRHHITKAVRVSRQSSRVAISLQNGERIQVEKVILATGNAEPRPLFENLQGYFSSPWAPGALSGLPAESAILVVGAGLTAVDAVLALLSQGHTGQIHMLSRRGRLPEVHTTYRPLLDNFSIDDQSSARAVLSAIRRAIRAARAQGIDWRAVFDSLRPVTNDIWQQFSTKERERVFRHLKTWWDIHRHRMAPEVGAQINAALASSHLLVHAGRLRHLEADGSALAAQITLRKGSSLKLQVERVINCTGPDSNYHSTENTFIRYLLEKRLAMSGSTGRGLRTTVHGELIGPGNKTIDWLLTLGPPRFGDLFETIAVPELRRQAEAIANRLLSIAREPVEIMPETFMAAGI